MFAQCLVQWVLTWSCPLVAIAEQTFDNKELASNARVKLSYRICIVCSLHASSSTEVASTSASKGRLKPKDKSPISPTVFCSGVWCIGPNFIRCFPSFMDLLTAVGEHFWDDGRPSSHRKDSHADVFRVQRVSSSQGRISAGHLCAAYTEYPLISQKAQLKKCSPCVSVSNVHPQQQNCK